MNKTAVRRPKLYRNYVDARRVTPTGHRFDRALRGTRLRLALTEGCQGLTKH